MNIFNITNNNGIIIIHVSVEPVFFMLLTVNTFEILTKHNSKGFLFKPFPLN